MNMIANLSPFRSALIKFFKQNGRSIAVTYIQVPAGLIVVLFFAYLLHMAIELLPFTFPASAVLMIILFIFLITIERFSPEKLSKSVHAFFGPSANWVLGNMGLFFTSSFILIPKRDPMPAKDIGLLCALFVPSFLATWIGSVGICKLLAIFLPEQSQEPKSEEEKPSRDLEEGTQISILESEAEDGRLDHLSSPRPDLELDITATMIGDNANATDVEDDLKKSPSEKAPVLMKRFLKAFRSQPTPEPKSAEDVWVDRMKTWFDPMVYTILFLIGLPLFFTPGGHQRSLPLFLATVSLAWLFSRRVIPGPWQKILHPILVTSGITILVIWVFGAIKGFSLPEVLVHYSTGSSYTILFRRDRGYTGIPPGSGDLLSSILVAGIVCLAFPLFRYRQDLYSNFGKILLVVMANCVAALLLWPYLAGVMGMDGPRAITFAGRFMSTPFGIELLKATGGDESLVVVLICVTGILAVLVRDYLFKLLRVRTHIGSDDYFTIGVTIGVIAGAIGTSSLLNTHPRAAATATVSFVIYGIALLSMVAIPTIAQYVGRLAGL